MQFGPVVVLGQAQRFEALQVPPFRHGRAPLHPLSSTSALESTFEPVTVSPWQPWPAPLTQSVLCEPELAAMKA